MNFAPSRDEFCALAVNHNIIPVYADLAADTETAVSIYYKIVGDSPGFMLESADTSKSFGRYSFIGAEPFMTIGAQKSGLRIAEDDARRFVGGAPLAALQKVLDGFSYPDLRRLPPFAGGAVGYLNYEAVATWERIRGNGTCRRFAAGRIHVVQDNRRLGSSYPLG